MATKSAPFSMRISKSMEELVEREAERTGRSKGAVVEALADEALRMRLFPGVAFRGTDWDRRAWVIGSAFDVWQIVEAYQRHRLGGAYRRGRLRRRASDQARPRLLQAVPRGTDAAIAENRRPLDQLGTGVPVHRRQPRRRLSSRPPTRSHRATAPGRAYLGSGASPRSLREKGSRRALSRRGARTRRHGRRASCWRSPPAKPRVTITSTSRTSR